MPDVDSKVCSKCEMDLPLSQYYSNGGGRPGLRSNCKACVVKQTSANRVANPEFWREYHREYRAGNRERIREHSRAYAARNPEKIMAWREANAEYLKAWRSAQFEANREYSRQRRARLAGSRAVKFSPESLAAKMSYHGNKCWICSGPFEAVDHVKPISKGGPHMLSNLRPSCRSCNSSKGAKWPLEELNFK